MVIRYDTSGIEYEKNALTCRMLCAWPLSQSQACEAVYCVKIVEPRHNVGGAQSRVCNFAEQSASMHVCSTSRCLRMAGLSKNDWTKRTGTQRPVTDRLS